MSKRSFPEVPSRATVNHYSPSDGMIGQAHGPLLQAERLEVSEGWRIDDLHIINNTQTVRGHMDTQEDISLLIFYSVFDSNS